MEKKCTYLQIRIIFMGQISIHTPSLSEVHIFTLNDFSQNIIRIRIIIDAPISETTSFCYLKHLILVRNNFEMQIWEWYWWHETHRVPIIHSLIQSKNRFQGARTNQKHHFDNTDLWLAFSKAVWYTSCVVQNSNFNILRPRSSISSFFLALRFSLKTWNFEISFRKINLYINVVNVIICKNIINV